MKLQSTCSWLTGLVLLCGLLACTPGGEAERDAALAVTWEMKVVEKTAGECGPEAAGPCARFRVEYPELSAGPAVVVAPLNAAIQKLMLAPALGKEGADSLDQMAEGFLAKWREAHEAFPHAATISEWFIDNRLKVIYHDPKVLSLEMAELAYTGGAHPNSVNQYASFDLTDGQQLTLTELLVPGYEPSLSAVAEQRFRELRQIPPGESLTAAGYWFENEVFALNDNFAVTDEGLLFYFNPYEVTAYALGPTELVISREDLNDLILPGGPLDRSD
jgi:hypothetical protein